MTCADDVLAYLEKLKSTLEYLNVSDCKMQEGSMRADVNLSVRRVGDAELGTRTETKNMNSFKAIARAIEYEIFRQIELLEDGGARVLYLAPGYLDEAIREMGLKVPEDMTSAMRRAGVHPVNWEELVHGR